MSFVVFSDLHLHNWNYGASLKDGFNSRLLDQQNVLHQLIGYCKQQKVNEVIFCGDWFHTHGKVAAEVLTVAHDVLSIFKKEKIKITFLVGNHDMADRAGNINSLGFLKEFGEVINHRSGRIVGGKQAHFLSYTENEEELRSFLKDATPDSYLFMHQGVASVPMGSGFVINEILKPDMIPDHICHAFTGHYHNHNSVTPKLTIVGTPLQLNWNDEGQIRGWLHVKDEYVAHIASNAPMFIVIDLKGSSDISPTSMDPLDNFVRVTNWSGPIDTIRHSLLNLGARSVEFAVNHKPTERIGSDSRKGFSLEETLAKFEKKNKLDERHINIGAKLREDRYEIPVI